MRTYDEDDEKKMRILVNVIAVEVYEKTESRDIWGMHGLSIFICLLESPKLPLEISMADSPRCSVSAPLVAKSDPACS